MSEPFNDGEKTVYCQYDEMMPLSEISQRRNQKNRANHSKKQIEQLAKIMKINGIRHPIVISTLSNTLVKGHCRLAAAFHNSWSTFPVQYQAYESEESEYQDGIADNAIAMQAELDLSAINLDIGDLGPFDLELLGFDDFTASATEKTRKPFKCPECGFEKA